MGRRVLWPHVQDHGLVFVGVLGQVAQLGDLGLAHPEHGTDLAEQLGGRGLRPRLHLLLAGRGAGDRAERDHECAPLNWTGIWPTS